MGLFGKRLTLSQTSPGIFTYLQYKPSENTVEKGEIAYKSNFSFSHSVFYPFGKLSAIFINFETVVCKLFRFGRV